MVKAFIRAPFGWYFVRPITRSVTELSVFCSISWKLFRLCKLFYLRIRCILLELTMFRIAFFNGNFFLFFKKESRGFLRNKARIMQLKQFWGIRVFIPWRVFAFMQCIIWLIKMILNAQFSKTKTKKTLFKVLWIPW